MMRAASKLSTGAMAVAAAMVLVFALVLIPMQGALAEILPIPMDVRFDVSSVSSVASADAEEPVVADAAFQETIIAVLENSHGDGDGDGDEDKGGDEIVSLVGLARFTAVESLVLFPAPYRIPHWGVPPRERPPEHNLTGA